MAVDSTEQLALAIVADGAGMERDRGRRALLGIDEAGRGVCLRELRAAPRRIRASSDTRAPRTGPRGRSGGCRRRRPRLLAVDSVVPAGIGTHLRNGFCARIGTRAAGSVSSRRIPKSVVRFGQERKRIARIQDARIQLAPGSPLAITSAYSISSLWIASGGNRARRQSCPPFRRVNLRRRLG